MQSSNQIFALIRKIQKTLSTNLVRTFPLNHVIGVSQCSDSVSPHNHISYAVKDSSNRFIPHNQTGSSPSGDATSSRQHKAGQYRYRSARSAARALHTVHRHYSQLQHSALCTPQNHNDDQSTDTLSVQSKIN